MRTFAAISAVFLVQCIYMYSHAQARAEPEAEPFDFFGVKSCVIGESDVINVYLYNSQFPDGKNLGNEQGCQYIDSSLPVVFITHGFTSSANETTFRDLAKAFVQKGHTAFIVDWAEAACTYGWSGVKYAQYCFAAGNTRMIGELMAKYTIDLNNKCKIPLKNIMYAGHSLGSHVCGFAAKSVKAAKKESIPLIWAFDPAFPGFIGDKNCEERVCMTDTERLVVFKTSVLGIWDPIGHCNLQFGDGFSQPACANKGMMDQVECSHSESIVYATNIVKGSCQYRAVGTTWLNNDFSKGGSDKNFGEKVVDFLGSMFVPTLPGLECLSDGLKDKLLEAIKKTTTSPDATSKDCIALNIDTLKNDNTKGQYYVHTDCVKGTDINCEQK